MTPSTAAVHPDRDPAGNSFDGHHRGRDDRKTACVADPSDGPAFERHADGSVTIRSSVLARDILRSRYVRQGGFNADLVARLPQKNLSILFKDGEAHRRQRSAVARLFAPAVVSAQHRRLMTTVSDRLIDRLKAEKRMAIDVMSLELTSRVTAEIVGLTDSRRPGLEKRLSRFFDPKRAGKANPTGILAYVLRSQIDLLLFYILDVGPAIAARRLMPRPDMISQLLEQGWSRFDILVECVTYATAGMATTRDFLVVAAWHLLDDPGLKAAFIAAPEPGKFAIIEDLLRLDPPVGLILRRATKTFAVDDDGVMREIAQDTLIRIDVRSANGDERMAGACPYQRDVGHRSGRANHHLSFGDGAHRCPGATVAVQETSILIERLLRLPGIRLRSVPTIGLNPLTTGYTLRDAVVTID